MSFLWAVFGHIDKIRNGHLITSVINGMNTHLDTVLVADLLAVQVRKPAVTDHLVQ